MEESFLLHFILLQQFTIKKLVDELKNDFRKLADFLGMKDQPKQYEERRCDYCMAKTKHEV